MGSVTATVTTTVTVPDTAVLGMIDTAGYGIAYWAGRADIDEYKRTYTITPNEEAQFYPEYDKDFELTFDKIVDTLCEIAVGKHKVGYPREYAQDWLKDIQSENEDTRNYAGGSLDTDIMDVVIQIACFGEIVFG